MATDDESSIKFASFKGKDKTLKLKKSVPKQSKPGNWRDGSVIDEDKKKGTETLSTNSVPASPSPIVNQLDDAAKKTFATGRPLEDTPKIQQCRHCKKSILNTAITAHVISCLKAKKEKAQRKKEQKEAREREKKGLDSDKKDDDGDTKMDDDDNEDDASPEKKGLGGMKSSNKSAGKKIDIDDTKKGKKRKADGDADKGPKQKKKKEEPKPKAPKPKGIYSLDLFSSIPDISLSHLLNTPGNDEDKRPCYGLASAAATMISPGLDPFVDSPGDDASRWFSLCHEQSLQPIKRGRGRPKGSRNKPKHTIEPYVQNAIELITSLQESSPTPYQLPAPTELERRVQNLATRRQARQRTHPSLGFDLSTTTALVELENEDRGVDSKNSTVLQIPRTPTNDLSSSSTRKWKRDCSASTLSSNVADSIARIPRLRLQTTSHPRGMNSMFQSSPPVIRSPVKSPGLILQPGDTPSRQSSCDPLESPIQLPPHRPAHRAWPTRGGKRPWPSRPKSPQPVWDPPDFMYISSEIPANNPSQGPVDVERQCGVFIKDSVQCARSLTCKSHSMGAKRAVPGRSLPYDMLLAAYQKKNQAKQQKAAIDANAPLEDEEETNGPFDSDEELQGVMNGLLHWKPVPVVQPEPQIPIQRKYQKEALFEQLRQATNGFTLNICAVKGYGYQKLQSGHPGLSMNADEMQDADGEVDGEYGFQGALAGRRPSGFNMQMPPSRRASMANPR